MPRGRPKKSSPITPLSEGKSDATFQKSYPKTPTPIDIAIEERLAACGRKEAEHIVYVGELVERTLKSEFGAVIRALTAGRVSNELSANRDGKLSSDRILGRLEMADLLWQDLEQFVLDKDTYKRPIKEDKEPIEDKFEYAPS